MSVSIRLNDGRMAVVDRGDWRSDDSKLEDILDTVIIPDFLLGGNRYFPGGEDEALAHQAKAIFPEWEIEVIVTFDQDFSANKSY